MGGDAETLKVARCEKAENGDREWYVFRGNMKKMG